MRRDKLSFASVVLLLILTLQMLMSWRRFDIATKCQRLGYPDWAWTHGTALCIKMDPDGVYVTEPLDDVRARMAQKGKAN